MKSDNDLIRRSDALAAIDQVGGAGGGFRDVLLKGLIYAMISTQVKPAVAVGVMTLDEVWKAQDEVYALHNGALWMETKFGAFAPCFIDIIHPDYIHNGELRVYSPYLLSDDGEKETWWKMNYYGKLWRLWTYKPTQQQMEDTPWEE